MNIKDFCEAAYQNAVAHGWYDKEFSMVDKLVMIHCEVSEAVEEYRNGNPNIWFEDGKPEGVCVELVDVIIRCADIIGYLISDGKERQSFKLYQEQFDASKVQPYKIKMMPVPDLACKLHKAISNAFSNSESTLMVEQNLLYVSWLCYDWISQTGINADELVMQKHRYNVSRPYRHGNKII